MYYYELIFTNEDESYAICSLLPDLTVEEANNFHKMTEGMGFIEEYGPIVKAELISREEVHSFFDDSRIDQWPIAVRTDTLWKEYRKYQTQWMIKHGYTIHDLMECLIEFEKEFNHNNEYALRAIYHEWIYNMGFGGEIWACFDEWKECEGKLFFEI